ncbi:helix-turn-helix transcriptional regulator [Shewanella donghaensis]|uniref:helix-turn-helix transcriptional regulator n=1 Tax=Shewanella donghaensis TaxID=238836 RepID=UPI001183A16B|nr:WYL domain-containing protein [Shewanella donghaensis]
MQINIQRQIAMLEQIPTHPRRITAHDIADKLQSRDFDVGLRTVQRELKAMHDMGLFGIVLDDRSKPFGWSIAACWRGLNLTLMDNHMALAFHTLKHSASQLLPPQSLKQLTPYFERADQVLGNDPDNPWLYWACRVAQLPKPFPFIIEQQDPQIFEAVQSALLNKRQIACQIKRVIEGKSYWIDYTPINPEGIQITDGVALLTFTIGTVEPKLFAKSIDLLRNVRLLDTPVITRSDVEIARRKAENQSELIEIELLFSPSANFIMRNLKLSENQRVEQLADGRYLVYATVEDTSGLRTLLWNMADKVEVVAPLQLRAHFTRLINKVNARYQNDAT